MVEYKTNNLVYFIEFCFVFGVFLSGCENAPVGNNFLSSPPSLSYTQDSVFTSKKEAKRLLVNIYSTLPYPLSKYYQDFEISQRRAVGVRWRGTMQALTDQSWDLSSNAPIKGDWYSGNLTSSSDYSFAYHFGDDRGLQWKAFYEGWTLINNIDKVPDMKKATKQRWKAEIKTIMALHYINMFRYIGGIVWVDHAYAGNDKIPEKPRLTAIASVDSIGSLLDQAIPDLPAEVPEGQIGRMTKVAAAGLKTRLLLFAASPLMNSAKPYMEGEAADKELVWMGGYKPELWKRAADAAKQTINLIEQSSFFGMEKPASQDSASYRKAYRKGYFDRGSGESLLSVRIDYKTGAGNRPISAAFTAFGAWASMNVPTHTYATMFPDKSGVPIKNSSLYDPGHPYRSRDPRFYETLTSNISKWGSRDTELWIGGQDRPQEDYGTAAGGYMPRKYVFNLTKVYNSPMHFSYLRVPEIYLAYAEALNEVNSGPTSEAYKYVNKVRNRVGLLDLQKIMDTPSSQEEFRRRIIRERVLEFGFENIRWFDMIRWKRKDIFTKNLKGLNLYKNSDGSFKYEEFNISSKSPRYWQDNFSPKWYLHPLPNSEIRKGYGLVQNPGWKQ